MRAVVYSQTGGPEVLRVVEVPVPQPGPGEVRVRIVVSGVNPTDWKARQGSSPGAPAPFPQQVPHQDGAGVVDAVGSDVTGLAVGQRVWVWEAAWKRSGGTAQDYVVLPARHVAPLADDAGFDVGASLGIPAITAHRCLTVVDGGPRRLGPGALHGLTVLVAGGAGAVGHAAIQLARWAGATVVTTVSGPEKALLARAAGAQHVLNYREQDVVAEVRSVAPEGVDIVVEVAPGRNAGIHAGVVADNATVAVYANDGGQPFEVPVRAHMTTNTRYQFVLVYTMPDEAKHDAVAAVSAAVADGAMPVGEDAGLPLHRFPLDGTAQAQAAVENAVTGKVLVDLG